MDLFCHLAQIREVEDGRLITKVKEIGTSMEAEGSPMELFEMWEFSDLISEKDKKLAKECTLLGLGIDLFEEGKQPEYVVRRILDYDKRNIAVTTEGGVRQGQIVQYQVRVRIHGEQKYVMIATAEIFVD